MLLVGYFENMDSQRGIAWRCADSLSLREFLGVPLDDLTPDHSTLTNTRKRLPQEVFTEVFQFVLAIAEKNKVSNEEWVSESDPESRITKMKDGRTHLAYKAEHVVDLKSDLVLAAEIRPATAGDTTTMVDSVIQARVNLEAAGSEAEIEEAVADKGYHAADTLELCEFAELRTYIPEPKRNHERNWTDRPAEFQRAVYNNRRRMRRNKGKKLQRARSELCERTFAHICDSGGARRTWLRGVLDVTKRYLIAAAAHNLGRILRKLFGIGKPKTLQRGFDLAALVQISLCVSPNAPRSTGGARSQPSRRYLAVAA